MRSTLRSRRDFLVSSAIASSWLALGAGARPAFARGDEAPKKLKMLILGGTALIGPELVEAATKRGHTVTLFNRGKTRPELFPDLEKLRGDRDPNKGEGLKALEGRSFDVVYDNCGYYPRMVKASAELLSKDIGHYVYVSSISCYASNAKEDQDETAALAKMDDPTLETMGDQFQYYGPLKALCEQASEAACPGKTTVVRPGYIVGPGDWSGRFTYWPHRASKGGEMLAPGAPTDPVQVIDVRDLAEWMVLLAENRAFGIYNACGPEKRLTMGEMLEASLKASKNDTKLTWIGAEWLETQGAGGDSSFPIWAPYRGESVGFHTWSNARAIETGLKCRPIDVIAKDTLEWFVAQPEAEQKKMLQRSGAPSAEREQELLAAWHAAKG